ncbi:MAG: ABC-type branched-chain amino acid transport system, ATPase component [Acidimicrobiales bacterium]|nr:ABC-type branched-chain amino acid transport system, ATPase component [Acidimicrobiales bacterium]
MRFSGLVALSDVTVEVEPGRVTGLIGPNGAGKTTCFNVITGLQEPSSGRVVFDGADITGKSPYKRARMGIARTFQKLEAFSSLSARDNVLVAAEQRKAWDRSGFNPGAVADELLERVGISHLANFMVGTLPTGTARLVELARALATDPKVLLLDEPSSGLNEDETLEVARLLRVLAADGLAVLLVEHDMSLVMGTCEVIDVLDFGSIIFSGTPADVQRSHAVQAAYLGSGATKAGAR